MMTSPGSIGWVGKANKQCRRCTWGRIQVRGSSSLLALSLHRGTLKFIGQRSQPRESGTSQTRGAQATALPKTCASTQRSIHSHVVRDPWSHHGPTFVPHCSISYRASRSSTGPTWSTGQMQHDNCSLPSVQLLISLCLLFWLHRFEKILIHTDK